jgi:hypothetical protein
MTKIKQIRESVDSRLDTLVRFETEIQGGFGQVAKAFEDLFA